MMKYYVTANGEILDYKVKNAIEIDSPLFHELLEASTTGTGRIVVKGKVVSVGSIVKKTVYSTMDGSPLEIYDDEDLPDSYCLKPREDHEAEWDGSDWVVPANVLTTREITALEIQITPRRLREATLGDSGSIAFIQNIENQIVELRGRL